ncbi:tail completion or Neck1 protein [Streptomyces phage Omar]|uniref:Uncharacterized protein n=1 Tax=Streptomyces phage Omar TaxID=2059882 RepID=A0A2H5BLI3_9CAUD|nr:tail completion or Neck1 protein [Streptomyces phage Omar]AUG87198.1 hypothetical protein SEA_OMAR_14 [Streptomyces phage Omar]
MAYVYRGLNGKNLEEFIASMPGVQDEVDSRAFEIGVRAEELLIQHRAEGIAQIEIAKGDIDAYVVLADANGTNAKSGANSALSIEFGRAAYDVEVVDETGKVVDQYTVGAMEGLHILERASHLPKKSGPKVKGKKRRIKAKAGKSKKRRGGRD